VLEAVARVAHRVLEAGLLLLQLDGGGLVHGQLGHGRHHLARHALDLHLQLVDLLRQLQRALAPVDSLAPRLVRHAADLVQIQLALQQNLLRPPQSVAASHATYKFSAQQHNDAHTQAATAAPSAPPCG
jgi:hypothetical protein